MRREHATVKVPRQIRASSASCRHPTLLEPNLARMVSIPLHVKRLASPRVVIFFIAGISFLGRKVEFPFFTVFGHFPSHFWSAEASMGTGLDGACLGTGHAWRTGLDGFEYSPSPLNDLNSSQRHGRQVHHVHSSGVQEMSVYTSWSP